MLDTHFPDEPKNSGWTNGLDGAKVNFIRLSHGGYKWDDGMGVTRADRNFLSEFKKSTRLKNVARNSSAISISQLEQYSEDGFPPLVFITGDAAIRGISNSDIKALRNYCLKGGMIFADAGSSSFDSSFRDLMRKVFPQKSLLQIADDDILYRTPYVFTNGAPTFWSHGGTTGLGIKHNSRWIVFYHPGYMNDAWKSSGYSDVTTEMKKNSYQLGINILYYAFNQWNDAIGKVRK